MGALSRRKGAVWERTCARRLTEVLGQPVARGANQSREGSNEPDVDLPGWWPECKVGARPNLFGAMAQAVEATTTNGQGRTPVVLARRNGAPARKGSPAIPSEDVAVLRLEDFYELLRRLEQNR